MEELPQGQNVFPSEVPNNNLNYSMFDQINHPGLDIDMGTSGLSQNLLKSKVERYFIKDGNFIFFLLILNFKSY